MQKGDKRATIKSSSQYLTQSANSTLRWNLSQSDWCEVISGNNSNSDTNHHVRSRHDIHTSKAQKMHPNYSILQVKDQKINCTSTHNLNIVWIRLHLQQEQELQIWCDLAKSNMSKSCKTKKLTVASMLCTYPASQTTTRSKIGYELSSWQTSRLFHNLMLNWSRSPRLPNNKTNISDRSGLKTKP